MTSRRVLRRPVFGQYLGTAGGRNWECWSAASLLMSGLYRLEFSPDGKMLAFYELEDINGGNTAYVSTASGTDDGRCASSTAHRPGRQTVPGSLGSATATCGSLAQTARKQVASLAHTGERGVPAWIR